MQMRKTHAGFALAATLLVFALLVTGITSRLRAELRARVLQREAESINAVVLMQLSQGDDPLAMVGLNAPTDAFAAVLESSRLRGVLAVQLFDTQGTLQAALPLIATTDTETAWSLSAISQGAPLARFLPHAALKRFSAVNDSSAQEMGHAPLLMVAVPLRLPHDGSSHLGVAHFWLDGAPVEREFALMDRGLVTQAGIAFLGGAILVTGVLGWSFKRLAQANDQLRAQSADLSRANEELAFSAKTAAIGAISAHLIHGLRNPLAGLEGFVADGPASGSESRRGDAWQIATDTTRRLREMVNEVLAVLQDETSLADYEVPAREVLVTAVRRVADLAQSRGVLIAVPEGDCAEIPGRSGNLAVLVLINLLTNAVEASARGGRVTVQLRLIEQEVAFEVRDEGAGLSQNVRAALFRPLTSTKKNGGGVGLAISHQLARHAGGRLTLLHSDGSGTSFEMRVPVSARKVHGATARTARAKA